MWGSSWRVKMAGKRRGAALGGRVELRCVVGRRRGWVPWQQPVPAVEGPIPITQESASEAGRGADHCGGQLLLMIVHEAFVRHDDQGLLLDPTRRCFRVPESEF